MVSALSGPSICPAASPASVLGRFNATECCAAKGDELVTRAREKMASFSGGVASAVFARSEHAHLRSFQVPERAVRRAGVCLLLENLNGGARTAQMEAGLADIRRPGGLLPNCLTKPLATTGTTLRPKFAILNRREIGPFLSGERAAFCCKSVINSDSPAGTTSDDKTPDAKEDGSILTGDGSELRNTVRLVECAMLAATAGLAYFLSNLLRIEAYFGCFFPLPVVISSMRWGASAGRKTMVATTMLLLILSGPLKAASYLLMHGFVGLAMGAFWKWNLNWGLSIAACTVVRCLGALGFVLLTSWLLRDNILALITMNAHASLSYMLAALGINLVPTMPMIYVVFASLLVVNCGSFVFLLHVLYAIFLRRLGLRGSITVPGWVERAM